MAFPAEFDELEVAMFGTVDVDPEEVEVIFNSFFLLHYFLQIFSFFCHFLFVILLSVSVEAKAKEKQQMFRYIVQFCLLLSHLF